MSISKCASFALAGSAQQRRRKGSRAGEDETRDGQADSHRRSQRSRDALRARAQTQGVGVVGDDRGALVDAGDDSAGHAGLIVPILAALFAAAAADLGEVARDAAERAFCEVEMSEALLVYQRAFSVTPGRLAGVMLDA